MHGRINEIWKLSNRLRDFVEAEINTGEVITWIGSPVPRLFARRAWPLVLFGIPWTAFAVFWMFGAAGFKMPVFQKPGDAFPLFGIPFILIGCGMLSSPLWWRYKPLVEIQGQQNLLCVNKPAGHSF